MIAEKLLLHSAIFTAAYVLPVIYLYGWNRKAHSKNGIFSKSDTDGVDVFLMLFPIVNIIGMMIGLLAKGPIKKTGQPKNYNEFFKVKK